MWEAVSPSTALLLRIGGGLSGPGVISAGSGSWSSRASLGAGGATGGVCAVGGIAATGISGPTVEDVSASIAANIATERPSDLVSSDLTVSDLAVSESRNRRTNPRNGDVTIDAPFHQILREP